MFFNKNIKYRDIIILGLIAIIGYKVIDNISTVYDMFKWFLSISSPFIAALVFGYALNPIMKLFENKFKMKRPIAILVTYLLVTGVFILGIVYLVPSVIDSIISLTSDVPNYVKKAQSWISDIGNNKKILDMIESLGIQNTIEGIPAKLGKLAISALDGMAGMAGYFLSLAGSVIKVVLGYLISIYVLMDKERIIRQSKLLTYMILKEKKASKLIELVRTYHKMICVYIGTKAIDSAIIGILAFIGLAIINVPYYALIAVIVAVTNMIPYVGPFVGEVVGTIIGIFKSPLTAFITFIFLFLLQQFDAWYLDPKLIGNKVGVRPLILLFAFTLGGALFGIPGMLLSSPTAATIKIFYNKKIAKYKESNPELAKEIGIDGLEENGNKETEDKKETE